MHPVTPRLYIKPSKKAPVPLGETFTEVLKQQLLVFIHQNTIKKTTRRSIWSCLFVYKVKQSTSGLSAGIDYLRRHKGISSHSERQTSTPPAETTRATRFVCCCFDLFSPHNSWGWGKLWRGGRRKTRGVESERRKTSHAGIKSWEGVFIQDHSPLCVSVAWAGRRWGVGVGVYWQACWPASWLAATPAANAMTRWQQTTSIARALSCHHNLASDTACWLAVSSCCCSGRLMKPRGWGRAGGTAWSCFSLLW